MIVSVGAKRTGIASGVAVLLIGLLVCAGSQAQASSDPTAGEISKLRILYAGHPGSDRVKDFVAFLRKYFDVVQTGNLETFKEGDAQGFDVTILDWDPNALDGPAPTISPSFSRPVITLGIRGALICRQWRLRTGYL